MKSQRKPVAFNSSFQLFFLNKWALSNSFMILQSGHCFDAFPCRVFIRTPPARDSSISCKPSVVFPSRFSSATQLQLNEADVVLISLKLPIRKYNHVFPVPCRIQAGAVFPAMGLGLVWSTELIPCFPSSLSWCSLKNVIDPGFQEKWNVFSLCPFACWCVL